MKNLQTLKCYICLEIKSKNPDLTEKQLFPTGQVEDAVTIKHGFGVCESHFLNLLT